MARTSSIHVYGHFDLYLTPVTLTFNLSKMFQMALLLLKCNNCFEIHALLYKLWSGQTGRTHGRTHIHRTKVVTSKSRLPANRLDNRAILYPRIKHVLKHSMEIVTVSVHRKWDGLGLVKKKLLYPCVIRNSLLRFR